MVRAVAWLALDHVHEPQNCAGWNRGGVSSEQLEWNQKTFCEVSVLINIKARLTYPSTTSLRGRYVRYVCCAHVPLQTLRRLLDGWVWAHHHHTFEFVALDRRIQKCVKAAGG